MDIRNIAIIAHVDHGKTTLVDALLRQSGTFRDNQRVAERALDSNDQERERGITILAKCTSVVWRGFRINIVDTPGHADFGGEVERILSMVDGVVILVDAAEGVLPQTKFVSGKALALGLRPLVIINKIDRADARPDHVLNEIFDLFVALDADEKQLDFPVLYASGRDGWAAETIDAPRESLAPLFDRIVAHVPPPRIETGPFRLLVTTLDSDPFVGRVLTGRIQSGRIGAGQTVAAISRTGQAIEKVRVTKLFAFRGLERVAIESAAAGDIVAVAGFKSATVADTLAAEGVTKPLAAQAVDPPTLAMTFQVNDSPIAGTEGSKIASRVLRARLLREAEGNVAIRVTETGDSDAFEVAGRGELQLGVLVETLRREGFELAISRPRVLFRSDPVTGQQMEPIEEVVIDVDDEFLGAVVELLSARRAELQDSRAAGAGKVRMVFHAPSRGMIGIHGQFLTDTRGTGVMNRVFHGYAPHRGAIPARRNGVLVSTGAGNAVPYALFQLEDRGVMFIDPGTRVYQGMIIGEHSRGNDLEVNPLKGKQLTNIRTHSHDEAVRLTTPRKMTLEQAITYIGDDELVEVTPQSIRLRKKQLLPHERKRAMRAAAAAEA
ncbi:MAG: translational GTPase TypA [Proteobacteria bacterium]|nr:translational GTPase TypA [Pseudomonadota bacterium]MDA1132990.1 translational GTPase TypA [Pseudomonadota bacterium]